MTFQTITGSSVRNRVREYFPTLVFVQGNEQRTINLDHSPFTVGRKVDKDLVIADPRVSRDHALIVSENGQFSVLTRAASTERSSTANASSAEPGAQRPPGIRSSRRRLRHLSTRSTAPPTPPANFSARFPGCTSRMRPPIWRS